jgi:hypothetical protein
MLFAGNDIPNWCVQGKAGMGKCRGRDAAADWKGKKTVFDAHLECTDNFAVPVEGDGGSTPSKESDGGASVQPDVCASICGCCEMQVL